MANKPNNPSLWSKAKSLAKQKFDVYPCVPLDSEALTKQGWKKYHELNVGEEILSYNKDTGVNEWTPVLSLQYFKDAPLVRLYKAQTNCDVRCTPNHKWVLDSTNAKYPDSLVEAQDITTHMKIKTSAPIKAEDQTGVDLQVFSKSDSWVKKVLMMSVPQLQAFFASGIVYDGNDKGLTAKGDKQTFGFSQKNSDHGDAMEIAAVLLGYRVCSTVKKHNPSMRTWTFITRSFESTQNLKKEDAGIEDVWCPTTKNQTWIMRQNGYVTITGNSAYANGWAAKWYKSKGGTWRKAQEGMQIPYLDPNLMQVGGLFPRFMQEGGEPDGGMALGQMAAVIDKLSKLREFISEDSDLEPWVSSKLAVMDHYADAVSDYMMYGAEGDQEEEEEEEDEDLSEDEMEEMKNGGIPERYRKRGFTRVGAKRQSNRPGKKWMVLAKKGDKYKIVHGGYKGMQDYTQHRNKKRQKNFWNRMGGRNSGKATDPFSPLYWHKRFGTWQEGGELPIFQDKGYFKTKEERDAYRNRLKEVSLSALANPNSNESYLQPGSKGPYCINGICGLNIAAGLKYMNPIDKDRYLGNPKFTDAINAGKEDYYRVNNDFQIGDHLVWGDWNGLGHHSKIIYNITKDNNDQKQYSIIHNRGDKQFVNEVLSEDELYDLVNDPMFDDDRGIPKVMAYRPGYSLDKEEVDRRRKLASQTPRDPAIEKIVADQKRTYKFETSRPGVYNYYVNPESGITDRPGVVNFLKYANDINDKNSYFHDSNEKYKNLLRSLDKAGLSSFANRDSINDALLNVFGQLGVENKWRLAPVTGVGPLTAAENVFERTLKPKSKSIGPGQIRFNSINKEMRRAFGIEKPKDLYDWNKVIPLMIGLDLSTRKWMRNQGEDFSRRITGEPGMASTEMMIPELGSYGRNPDFVEGRMAPYFYRGLGSSDIRQQLIKEAEDNLSGRMSQEERQQYIDNYVNQNLRSRQKFLDEGSYPRQVINNISKYLQRGYLPSVTNTDTDAYKEYLLSNYRKTGEILDPSYVFDSETGNLLKVNENALLQPVIFSNKKTPKQKHGGNANHNLNINFMNPLYDFIQRAQMGGQQQSQEEQLMQIIAMFAQMQGIDPQDLMQQLQQLSAEEQQQAIMQMAQAVQQQGADGQQQMMRSGGMPCFGCGGKYGTGGEMGGPVELPALPVDIYGIPTYGGGGAAYLNPYTDAMMEMAEGGKPEWLIRAQLKAQGYTGSALENKMSQMKQGGIHINPKNKGKFTAKANAAGMGVQAYASKVLGAPEGQYPASTRRQANFARNAAGWKKQDGGLAIGTVIEDADDELIKRLQDEGYTIEIVG